MKFYCTAGRGTEDFVAEDIRKTFGSNTMVLPTDGKTFFQVAETSGNVLHKITSLKMVERVFLQVQHSEVQSSDRRSLLTLLHTQLSDMAIWDECLHTLNLLKYLENESTSIDTISKISESDACSPTKRLKVDDRCSFRICCRLTGNAKKKLNVQKTSQQMGVLISKLLGWKIDLKHPKYEVNIHLSEHTLTVGIPVTSAPLSNRAYIRHCGLRTPVARIIASLLDMQFGDIVLDCMCGVGTILLEAAEVNKDVRYIGVDSNAFQLQLAAENLEHYSKFGFINATLIHADARRLPFRDNSIDGVVTDAPFGQNHTVNGDFIEFYRDFLLEITRVLKPGRQLVLLTSTVIAAYLKKCWDFGDESFKTIENSRVSKTLIDNESPAGVFENASRTRVFNDVYEKHQQTSEKDAAESKMAVGKNINDGLSGNCLSAGNRNYSIGSSKMTPENLTNARFCIMSMHEVKLGETYGCVCVVENTKKV